MFPDVNPQIPQMERKRLGLADLSLSAPHTPSVVKSYPGAGTYHAEND